MFNNFKITVMKKKDFLWSLLATMMVGLLSVEFVSCDPDPDPELTVSPEKLEFGVNADSKSFSITSNVGWTVVGNKDWITINQPSGGDNGTVYVDVEKNEDFSERSGRITITASKGDIICYVDVKQAGIESKLEVSPTSPPTVKGEGGTLSFQVSSNLNWSVSSSESWITLSTNEDNGNSSVTATISANGSSNSRSATLTFSGKEGNASPIRITINQEAGGISVSPTTASLLSEKGSTANLSVTATGSWTLSGCPDWLHSSATTGVGNTSIVLTALNANDMSDEARMATLTFTSNGMSATVSVSQEGGCPPGLRVETSNMTIMSDGFACDLTFGPNTKGYREAFFTEAAIQTMTDRDIYAKLMEQTEYSGSIDYTFLPDWVDPNTGLVYCVAAYGNESNSDGSHKYGPITIERITTKARTIYDDMYLSKSYNSTRWTVVASRSGSYGQRCDEFYYIAAEDDYAEELYFWSSYVTYAFVAHMYFKPMIKADRNANYKNGPQTMNWSRNGDKFFCTTWGIDRDTKEFSAELSDPAYYDLTSSSSRVFKRVKTGPADWNKPHRRPTQAEINKMRNSLKVIKVSK